MAAATPSASRSNNVSSVTRSNTIHRVVNLDRPIQVQNSNRSRQQVKGAFEIVVRC